MKCTICKNGITKPGVTVITLHKNGCIIVIKDVPAQICDNCGEYYLDEEVTEKLFKQINSSLREGIEIEVLKYVA